MRRVLPLGLLGVLLLAPVHAQDPTAPHLSPQDLRLYAHHHDSDTAELNGWMNTLVVDPTGNDVALGPQTTCCPQARVHAFTLAPALAGDVELDPAGNIVFEAFIGAGGSQGVVRVSTELRHGDDVVASGAAQNHVYQQAGTAAYPKLTWTVAPAITTLEQGKDLVWTISLTGVAVQTVFISVSPERGSTNIALPVLSTTASAPAFEAPKPLNGTVAAFNVTSEQPHNATHSYTWSTNLTAQELRLRGSTAAGNATLRIIDGANKTIHEQALERNETKRLAGAPGNWTFALELAGFAGDWSVEVGPERTSGEPTGSKSTTGTRPATSGTRSSASGPGGNTSADAGEGKDTPALGIVGLAALVAVAALVRRRLR